ncbi:MAG: hypothetical protein ND807_02340 [Vicinamibacterales bacterium]|nr:hypothetical protein [Vicinamibacterales bacterium]
MFIPPQGFRHAATLLLTNSIRSLPAHASPALVGEALERLAGDLIALAHDTKVPPQAAEWTADEYRKTLDRVSQMFSQRADAEDILRALESARLRCSGILDGIGKDRPTDTGTRDLFLMYVPEDRLPVAAPIAIELTKRRFTVAFSDYEVATGVEMLAGIKRGIEQHRAGVLLNTAALARTAWTIPPAADRFRVVQPANLSATVGDLSAWLAGICRSKDC